MKEVRSQHNGGSTSVLVTVHGNQLLWLLGYIGQEAPKCLIYPKKQLVL